MTKLENLELKARAQLIADAVLDVLPREPKHRLDVLRAMLNHSATPDQDSGPDGVSGWGVMPLSMVIGQNGIEDFEASLGLLKEMTEIFSSEFAVWYFLLADQKRALDS